MRGLQAWMSELSGRSGARFVVLLRHQLDAGQAAAALAGEVVGTGPFGAEPGQPSRGGRVAELRARRHSLVRQGDSARDELLTALADAMTTPIDRADLLRVSRSLDDISATLADFLREAELFGVADLARCAGVLPSVVRAVDALVQPVAALAELDPSLVAGALAATAAGRQVRRAYDHELSLLLRGPMEPALLMQREMLRRLDVVGLRVGEAAAALADGFVKRR
jgi:hypothetical protein